MSHQQAVHDHIAWCVVGVHRGALLAQRGEPHRNLQGTLEQRRVRAPPAGTHHDGVETVFFHRRAELGQAFREAPEGQGARGDDPWQPCRVPGGVCQVDRPRDAARALAGEHAHART